MTDLATRESRWKPEQIADGTYLIDLAFQRVPGAIGAFLLAGDNELVLVESGPTTTVESLEKGIAEAGYALADISRLIVSHIHLDHAGAAGTLMRMNPRLRLSVHSTGAPFLIDPERLVKSATRVFGDRTHRLWGDVEPVDADRVDVIDGGDAIRAAGRDLLVRHAPGHAGSHVVVLDQSTGVLFTGDAAGARLKGTDYVCPTLVPPELDVTLWAQTVEMMQGLGAGMLAVTHCGAFSDVSRHLDDVIPNLEEQIGIGVTVMLTPDDHAAVIDLLDSQEREEYVREGGDRQEVQGWMRTMNLAMPPYVAAQGLTRLFSKTGRFG